MIAIGLVASFNSANRAPGLRRDPAPRRAAGREDGRERRTHRAACPRAGPARPGPGRPAVATRYARATYSGMRRASSIRAAAAQQRMAAAGIDVEAESTAHHGWRRRRAEVRRGVQVAGVDVREILDLDRFRRAATSER